MNAGLPGAGIGGLFYLGSALLMPLRQLHARMTGRERLSGGWGVALSQAGLALAILGSMTAAGWAAGWLIHHEWTHRAVEASRTAAGAHPSTLAMLGLMLSAGSLAVVLVVVEVARLALRPAAAEPRDDTDRNRRSGAAAAVLLAIAALITDVQPLTALNARQLTAAERAVAAGAVAPTVMARPAASPMPAPGDTLTRDVARALAARGHTDAAIRAYEGWVALHPDDAAAWRELGRQRQRAGRLKDAAQALERALELEPDKGTRSRLAAIRVALRPAVEPLVGLSHDSDAGTRILAGVSADAAVARGRLGIRASRGRFGDAVLGAATSDQLLATLRVRPLASVDIDASAGASRLTAPVIQLDAAPGTSGQSQGNGNGRGMGPGMGAGATTSAPAPGTGSQVAPAARLRLRLRGAPGTPSLDVRGFTAPVDASWSLIAQHVYRDEVGGTLELPVGPFRLRGLGKLGQVRLPGETNPRRAFGGVFAIPVSTAVELSAQYNRLGYGHQALGGYFAPRLAETADAGAYIETSLGDAVSMAADLGGGIARLGRFGEPNGAFGPELRMWSMLSWTLAPGRALQVEAEAYDTRAGEVVTSPTATHWRYASLTTSLRLSIP